MQRLLQQRTPVDTRMAQFCVQGGDEPPTCLSSLKETAGCCKLPPVTREADYGALGAGSGRKAN